MYMFRVIWDFAQSADCGAQTEMRAMWIFSLRNAICRLHKFPDCAEHIHVVRNSRIDCYCFHLSHESNDSDVHVHTCILISVVLV